MLWIKNTERSNILFLEQAQSFWSWWCRQMETFSELLAICAGNSPVTGEFPHKGQWRRALMFSLICTWINSWVNNCEASDLRRHCACYDITVMSAWELPQKWWCHDMETLTAFLALCVVNPLVTDGFHYKGPVENGTLILIVMAKFESHIYWGQTLEWLKKYFILSLDINEVNDIYVICIYELTSIACKISICCKHLNLLS